MKLSLKTGSISFKKEHGVNDGSDRQVKLCDTDKRHMLCIFKLNAASAETVRIVFAFPPHTDSSQHRTKKSFRIIRTVNANTGFCHGRTISAANISHAACTLSPWAAACLFCSSEGNLLYLFPLYPRNAITCNSNEIVFDFPFTYRKNSLRKCQTVLLL